MQQALLTILENTLIARDVYKMILSGDTQGVSRPGQFVNIALEGLFLRRPISVCDYGENTLTLIYKTVGEGTERMSRLGKGDKLDVLTGLGNGFDISKSGSKPLLAGGGVGTPPMYRLAKDLLAAGVTPTVILGFAGAEDVFYQAEFEGLGINVRIATADGSAGAKGFVTDLLDGADYNYIFACGPLPMLKALYEKTDADGQYSFEERMGCGFGACMGCSRLTKNGAKRICKEGPVLAREEIIW